MGRKRAYGEGEIRISKALFLSEDIYSMGFMSQIRDDVMTKYLDIQTGKLIENEEEVEHRLGDEDKDLEPTKENYKPLRGVNNGLQQESNEEEDAYERVMKEQTELQNLQKGFQIRKSKRLNIFLHVVLCAVCQLVLVFYIDYYMFTNPEQNQLFS